MFKRRLLGGLRSTREPKKPHPQRNLPPLLAPFPSLLTCLLQLQTPEDPPRKQGGQEGRRRRRCQLEKIPSTHLPLLKIPHPQRSTIKIHHSQLNNLKIPLPRSSRSVWNTTLCNPPASSQQRRQDQRRKLPLLLLLNVSLQDRKKKGKMGGMSTLDKF